jgi:hypothetical protein
MKPKLKLTGYALWIPTQYKSEWVKDVQFETYYWFVPANSYRCYQYKQVQN